MAARTYPSLGSRLCSIFLHIHPYHLRIHNDPNLTLIQLSSTVQSYDYKTLHDIWLLYIEGQKSRARIIGLNLYLKHPYSWSNLPTLTVGFFYFFIVMHQVGPIRDAHFIRKNHCHCVKWAPWEAPILQGKPLAFSWVSRIGIVPFFFLAGRSTGTEKYEEKLPVSD